MFGLCRSSVRCVITLPGSGLRLCRRLMNCGMLLPVKSCHMRLPNSSTLCRVQFILSCRTITSRPKLIRSKAFRRNIAMYLLSIPVAMFGLSFASVPLYRLFCQVAAYGGTTQRAGHNVEDIESLVPVKSRRLRISFLTSVDSNLPWKFTPLQPDLWVHPGETALAFFQATNDSSVPIIGISTYNVVPFQAGLYFNKIQCFCFEEQLLNPGETVDMPVFFYVDPEYANDPMLEVIDDITLSYQFFESPGGEVLTPSQFMPKSIGTKESDPAIVPARNPPLRGGDGNYPVAL